MAPQQGKKSALNLISRVVASTLSPLITDSRSVSSINSNSNETVINGISHEEVTAVLPVPLLPTSPMTPGGHELESVPTTSGTWLMNSSSSAVSPNSQSVALLLIPLLLMLSLAFISGIALYCMQRRKKLDRLRHRLIPMYSFAPGEEDEWGVLLNHDPPRHHR